MTKAQEFRKKTEEGKFEAFSLMCKKVAELEQKLEQTEKDLADYQYNYPSIKELEKENAELKNIKDVADLIRLNNSSVVAMGCLNNKNTRLNQELAHAKELLKEWAYNYGHVNELLEQKSLSFINKE